METFKTKRQKDFFKAFSICFNNYELFYPNEFITYLFLYIEFKQNIKMLKIFYCISFYNLNLKMQKNNDKIYFFDWSQSASKLFLKLKYQDSRNLTLKDIGAKARENSLQLILFMYSNKPINFEIKNFENKIKS